MTPKQFFYLVSRMRDAQANYFKTRHNSYLAESKQLEKQVDAEIKRVNGELNRQQNPKLEF